ncbi:MAG TPA: arsenic resistance N-acetyltransferase ArsN2 [Longimicrobiales bacterium]
MRKARPGDADRIDALLRDCALPARGAHAGSVYFVAERDDGELLGAAGLEPYDSDGLLRSVAVDAGARGAGLGARLTGAILDEARRRGLRAVYALTTTAEDYFPRLGFSAIPRADVPATVRSSEEFAALCPSTATALVLVLGEPPQRCAS